MYARISDDQKGERLGVQDQVSDCLARCEREGWEVTPDVVFSDNDIGASKGKHRPGWEACQEAIRTGSYQVLVARDDGRFTRRLTEFLSLIELVEQHHLQVVCLWTDRWELSTASGRKRVRDSASDAQYEAERLGERVARARLREAKAGKPHKAGRRPWGFADDWTTHHETEADEVRDVARRILAGESLRSTSIRIGKQPKDVRRSLLNPRMIGLRRHHANAKAKCVGDGCSSCTTYQGQWDPILDEASFEHVGRLLRSRNRDRVAGVTARAHLLTGFVFCGVCGNRCWARKATRSKGPAEHRSYERYNCHPQGCTVRSLPHLDAFVRDELLAVADVRAEPESVDPALRATVANYEGRIIEARELWYEGLVSKAQYAADLAELESRLAVARTALDAAYEALDEPVLVIRRGHEVVKPEDLRVGDKIKVTRVDPTDGMVWWQNADLRQKRTVIARYMERIELLPAHGARNFDPASVHIGWHEIPGVKPVCRCRRCTTS